MRAPRGGRAYAEVAKLVGVSDITEELARCGGTSPAAEACPARSRADSDSISFPVVWRVKRHLASKVEADRVTPQSPSRRIERYPRKGRTLSRFRPGFGMSAPSGRESPS